LTEFIVLLFSFTLAITASIEKSTVADAAAADDFLFLANFLAELNVFSKVAEDELDID
jgi:hypothetical protein